MFIQKNASLRLEELSGTESAILNRESGDSESCDSNRAIPRSLQALKGCDSDGDSESSFCDSGVLRFDSLFLLLAAEFLAIPGPRFWESCDSRFCAAKAWSSSRVLHTPPICRARREPVRSL